MRAAPLCLPQLSKVGGMNITLKWHQNETLEIASRKKQRMGKKNKLILCLNYGVFQVLSVLINIFISM